MRGYTIEEVSGLTGMSPYVLRTQIHKGLLVARRLSPNYVRVLEADLKDWLDRAALQARKAEKCLGRVCKSCLMDNAPRWR